MNEDKNNPFAFPNTDGKEFCFDGMTLRDYFAGQVLNGAVSNSELLKLYGGQSRLLENCDGYLVKDCYRVADAMLKERNNHEN